MVDICWKETKYDDEVTFALRCCDIIHRELHKRYDSIIKVKRTTTNSHEKKNENKNGNYVCTVLLDSLKQLVLFLCLCIKKNKFSLLSIYVRKRSNMTALCVFVLRSNQYLDFYY